MIKFNKQAVGVKTSAVLLSRIVSATIALFFVPVYIKLLGVESYGLVAFYLLLVSVLVLIDFALSTALSRQVVILRARNEPEKSIKDLVFSMEIIYAGISLLIFVIIYLFAEKISLYWLKADELPPERLKTSIRYIGILVALQFPSSIYNGVMISLDKQILNSVISIIINVLKAVGVILVLKIFAPVIENYFIWQILITVCSVILLRYFVWKEISTTKLRPVFSMLQLNPIKAFAFGMFGVTIVNFLLSMVDKLVVSNLVMLNLVACYSLAFQLSSVMGQVITPLQSTVFPKFTALLTQNNYEVCTRLYHKSCKWVALIIWPLGLILFFFAEDILMAWTGNAFVTANTAPVLQIVSIGTIFNCLMFVPYIFMLSHGKTKFTIILNIVGAIIFLPWLFWSIPKYGILGASFIWLAINLFYFLIGIPLFHRLFMKKELLNWYVKDNLFPFLAAIILLGTAKALRVNTAFFDAPLNFILLISLFGIIYVYMMPELRELSFKVLKIKKQDKAIT